MLNRGRIENNPYRILGVYAGCPISVEVNHLNRIRAFSKVGQTASFKLRGDDVLRAVDRTQESAETATQTLSLPRDRVENALMWFSDGNDDWGRVLNDALQALLDGDYTEAINKYERLISDKSLRENFLESVTHGLLTMSGENLAVMISDLICAIEDDMEGFWMDGGKKPSGQIAMILFERTVPAKLNAMIQSVGTRRAFDLYQGIDHFSDALNEIRPVLSKVAEMYGTGSTKYLDISEELCRKVYAGGELLIKQIGEFVWLQGSDNRQVDGSYKKYRSKMPVGTIRACMDLISRVDGIVKESVSWSRIDDVSRRILYSEIDGYESTKRKEFVDNDDIIRRSVRSFQIKRGITIAAWLSALYWILFYL